MNGERNPGASEANTTQNPATMAKSPICAEAPASTSRRRAGAGSETLSSIIVRPSTALRGPGRRPRTGAGLVAYWQVM